MVEGTNDKQPCTGIPSAALTEISLHHLIGPVPELVSMIRHDLKSNGLVTVTESFDRTLAMAFDEAID
jgi:hypothetical protein